MAMREDRPSANHTPLDRAIDQVLHEMVSEDPPTGLSTKVRWLLLQHGPGPEPDRTDARTGTDADVQAGARAARHRLRWLVPVSSTLAVMLVAVLLWVSNGPGPGPDRAELRPGVARTTPRETVVGGGDTRMSAVRPGSRESAGVSAGTPAGAAPWDLPGTRIAASAGSAALSGSTRARRDTRGATVGLVAADESIDAMMAAAGPSGGVGAAVALGDLGDEEGEPSIPRLVVRLLPAPAGPALSPVQMHDMTIAEITIKPIEVVPLEPATKTNPEKTPKPEERR